MTNLTSILVRVKRQSILFCFSLLSKDILTMYRVVFWNVEKAEFFYFSTNENFPFISSNKCHSATLNQNFFDSSREMQGGNIHSSKDFLYVTTSDTHPHICRLCMRRVQVDKIVMEIVKNVFFFSRMWIMMEMNQLASLLKWSENIFRLRNQCSWKITYFTMAFATSLWKCFARFLDVRNHQILGYWFSSITLGYQSYFKSLSRKTSLNYT